MEITAPAPQPLAELEEHRPDVLDCIADLSSEEVFTSPGLANKMLDELPEWVWSDPSLRWLDPGCKSGVFLREANRRLMVGLADAIPDPKERRDHILKEMLWGIAITDLTAKLSRRSLYCSVSATSDYSIGRGLFGHAHGNIFYDEGIRHSFNKAGHCTVCGAPKSLEAKSRGKAEKHAYAFLHRDSVWENMKFDVIIGNPPYQLDDGGHGASASPIYQLFVEKALDMKPRFVSMIIPARWFAGGKGLDSFRERMINDRHLSKIVDYPKLFEAFPGVELKGGVCYFLWDSEHDDDCEFVTFSDGKIVSTATRDLRVPGDVLIRSNESLSILKKVQSKKEDPLSKKVSRQKPFGLRTNFSDYAEKQSKRKNVMLYRRGGIGWISESQVLKNSAWVDEWKVFLPMASDGHGRVPAQVLGKAIAAGPATACTETYLAVGPFASRAEADSCAAYLNGRMARFLVSLRKNTQHTKQASFSFVPDLPMDRKKPWTDEELYKRYDLSEEEIAHIESTIKAMD